MDDGSLHSQASPTTKGEGHELTTSPYIATGDAANATPARGGGDGTIEGVEQPKAKRRRVAVACKSCRYRKSRVWLISSFV
jgi:hypothetical protein